MTTHYADETNGLINGQAYHDSHHVNHAGTIPWTDRRLKQITRLRLLTDPGYPSWDVSYCHGVLHDGRTCDVELPFSDLPKRGMWRAIIAHGQRDHVFVKRILDDGNISKLW
jgi:hypothetical protein